MKIYTTPLLFFISVLSSYAQTTAIPDTQFEQILINQGIDSDNTLNGQVLTSDIVGVLHLNLQFVNDLTGLQDFAALESLSLQEGGGANITLDLTANSNLKKVEIYSFGGLSKLDLTGLASLEELWLMELHDDVITMPIDSLNLSTNPNIGFIELGAFNLYDVNLKNGNNVNMLNLEIDGDFPNPNRPICLKVDDAVAANADTAPYSSWIINGIAPIFYDTGVCTLSAKHVEMVEVALYPNPVQDKFQLKSPIPIKGIKIFSLQGKQVARFSFQENYDVSGLQPGMYFLKVSTPTGIQVMCFVKKL